MYQAYTQLWSSSAATKSPIERSSTIEGILPCDLSAGRLFNLTGLEDSIRQYHQDGSDWQQRSLVNNENAPLRTSRAGPGVH